MNLSSAGFFIPGYLPKPKIERRIFPETKEKRNRKKCFMDERGKNRKGGRKYLKYFSRASILRRRMKGDEIKKGKS